MKSLKLEFLSMDVLWNPSEPIKMGDVVPVRLKCRANDSFENMKLRFEITASDNTLTGTMFLSDKIVAEKGDELMLDLGICTDHLAPGNYRFDLLAFEQNDFGIQDWVDRVEGAPILEIEKRNDNDLDWLTRWWGHTCLEDIRLQKKTVV